MINKSAKDAMSLVISEKVKSIIDNASGLKAFNIRIEASPTEATSIRYAVEEIITPAETVGAVIRKAVQEVEEEHAET